MDCVYIGMRNDTSWIRKNTTRFCCERKDDDRIIKGEKKYSTKGSKYIYIYICLDGQEGRHSKIKKE